MAPRERECAETMPTFSASFVQVYFLGQVSGSLTQKSEFLITPVTNVVYQLGKDVASVASFSTSPLSNLATDGQVTKA